MLVPVGWCQLVDTSLVGASWLVLVGWWQLVGACCQLVGPSWLVQLVGAIG